LQTFKNEIPPTTNLSTTNNIDTEIDGRSLWKATSKKELLTYEETCKPTKAAQFNNGFFSAFLYAYNIHGDVRITPDDVWLTIMLYFSKYVNDNSEELRNAFVTHAGKKKLTVTTKLG